SLDKNVRTRIITKVGTIVLDPFHFIEHLEGWPWFKLRIGDYRAVLEIKRNEQTITVVLVGHRSNVYQRLRREIQ
ncbi:MAG: type II toxin-antitoxin system RelE/ParE family toxin, partial [Nanoarchaeota archaeon]